MTRQAQPDPRAARHRARGTRTRPTSRTPGWLATRAIEVCISPFFGIPLLLPSCLLRLLLARLLQQVGPALRREFLEARIRPSPLARLGLRFFGRRLFEVLERLQLSRVGLD